MHRRFALLAFALTAGVLAPGCGAQKSLEARIERDGELVLKTSFGVNDQMPPAAAWKELAGKPFKAVGPITPDADGKTATFKGKIRIELKSGGTHFASADVQELRLTKVPGSDNDWEIPQSEIERTAKAAGFKPD